MYVLVEDPKPYYTAHACRVGHNKDLTISSASAESVVTETPDKVTVCLVHAVAITIHSGLVVWFHFKSFWVPGLAVLTLCR